MSPYHLINRILVTALVCMLIFFIGVGLSIDSVRRGLNTQSTENSVREVGQRLAGLQAQVRTITQDYNNWGGIHSAAMNGDISYIADNYGITAIIGDIFDHAMMFDGPFESPLSWRAGGSRLPDRPQVSERLLAEIRDGVSLLEPGDRSTLDFMTYEAGRIIFHSASRLLPDTSEALAQLELNAAPIAVISRELRASDLALIADDLDLVDLRLEQSASTTQAALALFGLDRLPIAKLVWIPPPAGNRLIRTIAPILLVILSAILVLSIIGLALLRRNARALVEREFQAVHLARLDVLTGLPNRLAFMEHLSSIIARAPRQIAIIVIDLDGFKNVNDLAGHAGGDDIIRQYAARLQKIVSKERFIARMGGDEFVAVITDELDAGLAAQAAAQDIIAVTDVPFSYQGFLFDLTASCGIAVRSGSDEEGEELLRRADRAMYQAKGQVGSQVSVYQASMDSLRLEAHRIGRALRPALQSGEFTTVYQPIIDGNTGKLVRVEALARWQSPELGTISPATFVSIAEQTGCITLLGEFVLEAVCMQARRHTWLRFGVNVSPSQLLGSDFVRRAMPILQRHQVSPTQIEIELTESIAVKDLEAVGHQLLTLQGLGFTIALDDFGTGFSSIGYLRRMPFDVLKIDRSFVTGLTAEEIEGVVRPMVLLGHSLGKIITAEGVESAEEAAWLRAAGCDQLQGYLFGRPQNLDALLVNHVPLIVAAE